MDATCGALSYSIASNVVITPDGVAAKIIRTLAATSLIPNISISTIAISGDNTRRYSVPMLTTVVILWKCVLANCIPKVSRTTGIAASANMSTGLHKNTGIVTPHTFDRTANITAYIAGILRIRCVDLRQPWMLLLAMNTPKEYIKIIWNTITITAISNPVSPNANLITGKP